MKLSTLDPEARKSFRKICNKLLKSDTPNTARAVVKLARRLQTETALAGRQLSLESKFYVYAILDPRQPGEYTVQLPGEKIIRFSHQPFYIGKGTRNRMSEHVREALSGKETHKARKIRRILDGGCEPIFKRLSVGDIESVALAKEIILIKAIGRHNLREGPLTNLTDGGEGISGAIIPESARRKVSKALRGRKNGPRSEATKAKISAGNTGKKRTEEQLAAVRGIPKSAAHRAALSKANKGKKLSLKTRKAISRARKGINPSIEHRAALSLALKGRSLSDSHRRNMSLANKGKPWSAARRAAYNARSK